MPQEDDRMQTSLMQAKAYNEGKAYKRLVICCDGEHRGARVSQYSELLYQAHGSTQHHYKTANWCLRAM